MSKGHREIICELGNQIARERIKQRLTQVELAGKLKCSTKLIRCFEEDEKTPSFFKILQICDALGISLGQELIQLQAKD